MDKSFGGVVWTNHALERLKERGIKQGDAWVTFRRPDQSRRGQKGWVFYKTYPSTALGAGGSQRIEVVASKNEKDQWIILSVWSRPLFQRTHAIKPSTRWDNLLEAILRRILGGLKKP